jgi:hypothetical protein
MKIGISVIIVVKLKKALQHHGRAVVVHRAVNTIIRLLVKQATLITSVENVMLKFT